MTSMQVLAAVTFVATVVGALPTSPVAQPAASTPESTPGARGPMTNARLAELFRRVDQNTTGEAGHWEFAVEGHPVLVITDEHADRMRILAPITTATGLDQALLLRLMQANFDSALDGRYAIARGIVWGAFIHPLGPLTDAEFLSGIGQVVNLAVTYGTTYSSGELIFRGGDSSELQRRELIDRLLKKGGAI